MQIARPGPIWGHYPTKEQAPNSTANRLAAQVNRSTWLQRYQRSLSRAVATEVAQNLLPASHLTIASTIHLAHPQFRLRLERLRAKLRQQGLQGTAAKQALHIVAQVAAQTHGLVAHPAQLRCAWLLIHQTLVELPTGEGKSLTAALAAAVLGLAYVPVHLMTANDYLAKRDADHFQIFYQALGLTVAATADSQDNQAQQIGFQANITYCTTRTAAFAYLRDIQLSEKHPNRILRGLCCAIVDEADVSLLDEARTPLILAQQVNSPGARVRAFQAMAQARQLQQGTDFELEHGRARLTQAGQHAIAHYSQDQQTAWINQRHHREQIEFALKALHQLRLGRDYVVLDSQIELLDIHSGRIAQGKQLSHGLHDMLAVKEGLPIPKQTEQIASISYARFFAAYYRLSGLSGTLADSRQELSKTYGRPVVVVPPHQPSQRQTLQTEVFFNPETILHNLVQSVAAVHATTQPILLATQDVAQTEWVAKALKAAGLPCKTLTAQDEPSEAQIIAQAGQPHAITVATQLAGRGTDILLAPESLAAGGLLVMSLQLNRNRRTDRQVFGRSARQGQPGQVQRWVCASAISDSIDSLPKEAQNGLRWVMKKDSNKHSHNETKRQSKHRVLLAHWLMQQAWERDDRFMRAAANRAEQNWAQRLLFSTVKG